MAAIRFIPYKEFIDQLIQELANDGEKAIREAYSMRTFTNRTFNLYDSYASAVYVNGRLVKSTIRYLGPEQTNEYLITGWKWDKPRSMPDFRGNRRSKDDELYMTGREEAMDFLSQYTPPKKGISLVIVAAMWYANVLERGGGNLRRKWRVISGAASFMESLAIKYKGQLAPIDTGRVLSIPTTIKGASWK